MLNLDNARPKDVRSLQNWVSGTSCLAREETAYLGYERELVGLAPTGDGAMKQFEAWVEDVFIRLYRGFRTVRGAFLGKMLTD